MSLTKYRQWRSIQSIMRATLKRRLHFQSSAQSDKQSSALRSTFIPPLSSNNPGTSSAAPDRQQSSRLDARERVTSGITTDERLAALEGLRGYAAFLVFLVHAFGLLALLLFVIDLEHYSVWADRDPIRVLFVLLSRSNYGVDLFFVLSGLLMTDLLVQRPGVVSLCVSFGGVGSGSIPHTQ